MLPFVTKNPMDDFPEWSILESVYGEYGEVELLKQDAPHFQVRHTVLCGGVFGTPL